MMTHNLLSYFGNVRLTVLKRCNILVDGRESYFFGRRPQQRPRKQRDEIKAAKFYFATYAEPAKQPFRVRLHKIVIYKPSAGNQFSRMSGWFKARAVRRALYSREFAKCFPHVVCTIFFVRITNIFINLLNMLTHNSVGSFQFLKILSWQHLPIVGLVKSQVKLSKF